MRREEGISEKEKMVDGMGAYLRITIFVLIALLVSCMEQNELDYYPMSIGSKWEYVGKMKRGPGKIISVKSTGLIEGTPELVSRGHIQEVDAAAFLAEARHIVIQTIEACSDEEREDPFVITETIRSELKRYFRKRTGTRPMIVPVIMQI